MEEQKTISIVEKRWLVRELETGRMTIGEAKERLMEFYKDPSSLLHTWRKKYASDIVLTLPIMTEKEKQKVEALREQLKKAEKQLEDAQMKNIALETMIDIAEEQLKISIRKKSGPKQ
jgi:translation initiation factor 2B subunit (eIF-2B alpha/beta/delta family)